MDWSIGEQDESSEDGNGVEINFNQGACWIPTNPSHAIHFQATRPHITGQFKNQKNI